MCAHIYWNIDANNRAPPPFAHSRPIGVLWDAWAFIMCVKNTTKYPAPLPLSDWEPANNSSRIIPCCMAFVCSWRMCKREHIAPGEINHRQPTSMMFAVDEHSLGIENTSESLCASQPTMARTGVNVIYSIVNAAQTIRAIIWRGQRETER